MFVKEGNAIAVNKDTILILHSINLWSTEPLMLNTVHAIPCDIPYICHFDGLTSNQKCQGSNVL